MRMSGYLAYEGFDLLQVFRSKASKCVSHGSSIKRSRNSIWT